MIKESDILIENTDFTVGWLLKTLKERDNNFTKFHHLELVKYNAENIGTSKAFMSQVFRIRMYFAQKGHESDMKQSMIKDSCSYSIVLKIPGSMAAKSAINNVKSVKERNLKELNDANENPNSKKNTDFDDRVAEYHEVECKFYEEIAPRLNKNFPLGKIYSWKLMGKQQTGYLVMQDLIDNKSVMMDFFDTYSILQIEEVVRNIAQFHRWSLKNRALWEGNFLRHQNAIEVMANLTVKMSPQLCQLAPGVFDHLIDKLKPFFLNQYFLEYFNEGARRDSGLPKVLVHGDLWSHNIIWERCEDIDDRSSNNGNDMKLKLKAIIDWQIMHEGNLMNDLARLLLFCCDADVRKNAEEYIFDYYKIALIQSINDSETFEDNLDDIPNISIEQLKFAYKYAFLHEVCILIFIIPILFGLQGISENNMTISPFRKEKIIERAKIAFQDAISILEMNHPEWLSEECKSNDHLKQ